MAKIIVNLGNSGEQESVCAHLRLKKHTVSVLEKIDAQTDPKTAAAAVIGAKPDIAILEYYPGDAASVKMLQSATEHPRAPRFIFILPEGAPVAHILMAVNEGAAAILERPINLEALNNYVERAMNGPSRFRHDLGQDCQSREEIASMERDVKSMRIQLAASRKLVSYLMLTPPSNQARSALIVSDSAYQREQLRKVLEEHGFRVSQAENPDEGLTKAMAEKPRVVISDLEMEGKNGVEFCRDLKIIHKLVPCYFVICTANTEKIDLVMAPGNGVDACVLKPSNENGYLELVAAAAMGLLL